MEDLTYNELVTFFTNKDYGSRIKSIKDPNERKCEKKKLRSRSSGITCDNGMLYKDTQRLLRKHETAAVIQTMHAGKYSGGHLGRDKTLDKIKDHYYWKGMKEDVRNYVRDCDACSRVTIGPVKSLPPLNPIPVPEKVWSLVGIDIMGPLETTPDGNKYIVAMTDHFSKFSVAAAIPDKSTDSVAKFLLHNISVYGPMDSLISDQGREFTSKVIDNLTNELEIDHRISSAYHPQTNGQRERDNRTLKEMLQKTTNENGSNWDKQLDSVMFAYRTSVHASTKHTPFEVMFGRKARLVSKPLSSILSNQNSTSNISMDEMKVKRLDTNRRVGINIEKAQKRQKKNYDLRHNSHKPLNVGQNVLIKNAKKIRRFGGKLVPRWVGPYRVVEALTKGRVRLENLQSNKVLSNVYHSSNLKLYTAKFVSSSTTKVLRQTAVNNKKNINRQKKKVNSPKKLVSSSKTRVLRQTAVNNKKNINRQKKKVNSLKKLKQCRQTRSKVPSGVKNRGKEKSQRNANENRNDNEVPLVTSVKCPEVEMFRPPSKEENKQQCEKLNIDFVKQPSFKEGELKNPKNIHKVVGDGNCFFRAVSFSISGTEKNHVKLRDQIVDHMSSPTISASLKGYLSEDVGDYLERNKMRDNAVWATDAEIMGAASLLHTDIFVYTLSGESNKWLKYPSTFCLDSLSASALYIRNKSEHFDVVLTC